MQEVLVHLYDTCQTLKYSLVIIKDACDSWLEVEMEKWARPDGPFQF